MSTAELPVQTPDAPIAPKAEYSIMLGIPSLGKYHCDMALSLVSCSKEHRVDVQKASSNWDNFSILWAIALNAAEAGQITHFAMLHDDVIPEPLWIDKLIDELETHKVSLISSICPIKDHNGISSSGVGQVANPYASWRRLTLWECYHAGLPQTFDLDDIRRCLGGRFPIQPYLLHNNACWVADLRDPLFHAEDEYGYAKAWFQFPKRMYRTKQNSHGVKNAWMVMGESEDWFFSRKLWELGVKTKISTKIALGHDGGSVRWTNQDGWGAQEHDEATRANWDLSLPEPVPELSYVPVV